MGLNFPRDFHFLGKMISNISNGLFITFLLVLIVDLISSDTTTQAGVGLDTNDVNVSDIEVCSKPGVYADPLAKCDYYLCTWENNELVKYKYLCLKPSCFNNSTNTCDELSYEYSAAETYTHQYSQPEFTIIYDNGSSVDKSADEIDRNGAIINRNKTSVIGVADANATARHHHPL